MATVPKSEDELRLLEQAQQGEQPQLSSGLGGVGGGPSAPGGVADAGGAAPAKRGGAPQVTLDQYLAANRGAVNQLGDRTVGVVTGAGQAARDSIGQGLGAFNSAVDQGTVRDSGLIGRLAVDPQAIAGNQNDAAQFARQRDATYAGPRALEETAGYGDIATRIVQAREAAELAKSETGVAQLTDRAVTGQRTAGGRALDAQLVRGDEGLRGRLDAASQGIGALEGELTTASTTAQQRALQGQQATAQTRDQTRGALASAQQSLQKAIDERVAVGRQQAAQRAAQAQQALAGDQSAIPTAGAAGRYYGNNDPTQGPYQDRAAAPGAGQTDPGFERALAAYWATPEGKAAFNASMQTQQGQQLFAQGMARKDTPEFIHNTSGAAALPGFDQYIAQQQAGRGAGVGDQALADLGLNRDQLSALLDLTPAQEAARASATGTNNVNPYSFVEDFRGRIGDLSKFLTVQNPDAMVNRENAATSDQYGRAAALEQLGGPLGQRLLDPTQSGRADTASTLNPVRFDAMNALEQRNAALQGLDQRVGSHVAGNARSGGDSFFRKYGQAWSEPGTLWGGPLAPLIALVKASQ